MKLPCHLVQDLLPLYKDHVCDEQTSADVAEHLSDCAACSALLAEMDAPPPETALRCLPLRPSNIKSRPLRPLRP